jgi:hypothetical protein
MEQSVNCREHSVNFREHSANFREHSMGSNKCDPVRDRRRGSGFGEKSVTPPPPAGQKIRGSVINLSLKLIK